MPPAEFGILQTLTGLIVSDWAPVVLQDTDDGAWTLGQPENGDGAADFVTRFDYDGNWDAWDNWDNLVTSQLKAYVYTTIAETQDFWFVTYHFVHPRDWCHGQNQPAPWDPCIAELEWYHENDMEGVVFVVRKDPVDLRGKLWDLITTYHTGFQAYVDPVAAAQGHIWVQPGVPLAGLIQYWNHKGLMRPMVQIQARGHGVSAGAQWQVAPNDSSGSFPGGDGVIYWLQGRDGLPRPPEVPTGLFDADVSYDLIWVNALGGLWSRRLDLGVGTPFDSQARMYPSRRIYAKTFGANVGWPATQQAHPPWAYDSGDDTAPIGYFLEDPAGFAMAYFVIPDLSTWDYCYLYNPHFPTSCIP